MFSIKQILGDDTVEQVVNRIAKHNDLFNAECDKKLRKQVTLDELINEKQNVKI